MSACTYESYLLKTLAFSQPCFSAKVLILNLSFHAAHKKIVNRKG